MNQPVQAYPLTWPAGWKRISAKCRKQGRFTNRAKKWITVSDGVDRILEQLRMMGVDRQDVIISTNVRTRLDGLPRSGESEPSDPGAAVYWRANASAPMVSMAIDQYSAVADNLGAIAATLEAMRAIERHGGAAILERAFMGFKARPEQTAGPSWWETLGVTPTATVDEVERAFKVQARMAHPDVPGGSHEQMALLNEARAQALGVLKGEVR